MLRCIAFSQQIVVQGHQLLSRQHGRCGWKRGSCTSKNGHALRRDTLRSGRYLTGRRIHSARLASNIGLLGDGQSVIDLDTEIANRALDLGVTEQQLDGPQIAGAAIDQRSLGPPL